jgi:putative ABC transport system ATP-binding protein
VTDAGPAVVVRDIHKSFGAGPGRVPILRGVSLTVARGETVFLVGPSGSGKTTLLSVMGCLLTPDAGAVQILGRELTNRSPEERTAFRRENLGFIFQSFNLFPTLSALDNVRLAMTIRAVGRRAARARAMELLEQVGLGRRAHTRPARLSTGECQRVAIARSLANDPTVMFADEPTASLDADNGQIVLGLLSSLVRVRNAALVVVTHDDRIFPFADRIVRLDDGRVATAATPSRFELSL